MTFACLPRLVSSQAADMLLPGADFMPVYVRTKDASFGLNADEYASYEHSVRMRSQRREFSEHPDAALVVARHVTIALALLRCVASFVPCCLR